MSHDDRRTDFPKILAVFTEIPSGSSDIDRPSVDRRLVDSNTSIRFDIKFLS